LTQQATVTKLLPNGMAEIAVKRESACGGNCHSCSGCSGRTNIMKVAAKNPVLAAVGDRVVVSSSTGSILKAAVVVYVIPVILFFVFYALGALMGAGESMSIVLSLVGFFLGVIMAMAFNKSLKNKTAATFEIISILQA